MHPVQADQKDMYINNCPFKITLNLFSHHVAYEHWWKWKAQSILWSHQPDTYACMHIHMQSSEREYWRV